MTLVPRRGTPAQAAHHESARPPLRGAPQAASRQGYGSQWKAGGVADAGRALPQQEKWLISWAISKLRGIALILVCLTLPGLSRTPACPVAARHSGQSKCGTGSQSDPVNPSEAKFRRILSRDSATGRPLESAGPRERWDPGVGTSRRRREPGDDGADSAGTAGFGKDTRALPGRKRLDASIGAALQDGCTPQAVQRDWLGVTVSAVCGGTSLERKRRHDRSALIDSSSRPAPTGYPTTVITWPVSSFFTKSTAFPFQWLAKCPPYFGIGITSRQNTHPSPPFAPRSV